MPLSVWKAAGWDADLIEQNTEPEDIKEGAQTGKAYRVRIHSSVTKRSFGRNRVLELAADSKRKCLKPRRSEEDSASVNRCASAEEQDGPPTKRRRMVTARR